MVRKRHVLSLMGAMVFALYLDGSSARAVNLLHHWTLDETSGSTVADSVGGNDGTIADTAGLDLTAAGQSGTAGDFTGSFITIDGVYFGNVPRAISLWFNADAFAGDQRRLIGLGAEAPAGSFNLTAEVVGGNNSVRLRYGNGNLAWSGTAEFGQALQTNTWYHLVIQYDGTALQGDDTAAQCFINGQQMARDGGNGNNLPQVLDTAVSDNYIGAKNPAEPRLFDGRIDDVQFYDGPLSADEVSFLFNNPGLTINLAAGNPMPANGAIAVPTDSDLQWDAGVDPNNPAQRNPDVTQYFVYLMETDPGADPNFLNVVPVTVNDPGSDPVTLANANLPLPLVQDKEYHWRVDQGINNSGPADPNTIAGNVWSFEAVKSIPVVTADPQRTAVFAGQSVTFTCLFTSISAVTDSDVVWTKNSSGAPGVAVLTDLGSGTYRSDLTIAGASPTDEGDYICAIREVSSLAAELMIKRKLAHWEFEGNFEDSENNFDLSVFDPNNGAPIFVSGLVGSGAIDCNGVTDGLIYSFAQEKEFFAGYTVSLWTRTDAAGQGEFTSVFSTQSTTNPGFQLDMNANENWRYRDGSNTAMGPVNPGDPNWVLLTVVGDPNTDNDTTLYYNGLNVGRDGQIQTFVDGFSFGLNRGLNIFYNGQIDDAMFWNYPLSQNQIGQVYFDVTGRAVCDPLLLNAYDFSGPEGVPDCVVDFLDFLPVVEAWLDCTILPVLQCN